VFTGAGQLAETNFSTCSQVCVCVRSTRRASFSFSWWSMVASRPGGCSQCVDLARACVRPSVQQAVTTV
jgi:hypothetical protein